MPQVKLIKHWRVYCNTDNKFVYSYKNEDYGTPSVCLENPSHTIDSTKTLLIENIYDNFSKTLHEWSIYCNTEQAFITGYTKTSDYPQDCFNDVSHSVSKIPSLVKVITNNNVQIQEESIDTGGHFRAVNYKMTCPVGVSAHDYSYKHPVSALSITIPVVDSYKDDSVEVQVGPDAIIGNITSNISISDTVINVSSTVVEYIKTGFYVNFFTGALTEPEILVVSVDKINNTITLASGVSQNFSAATPTYVRMTIKLLVDFTFGHPSRLEIGKDKIGGSYIPTGTVIRVVYTNNGSVSKDFYTMIELLY
jgi:hypothetical protein